MIPTQQTAYFIDTLNNKLPHALIVHGQHGLGKLHAVRELIKKRHPEAHQKIDAANWQYLLEINQADNKQSIGIAQIKSVEQLTSLREPHARYIVINKADTMTIEAQNAFLKTLEEPPEQLYVLLLSKDIDSLLPTIRSRSQLFAFASPSEDEFSRVLADKFSISPEQASRLYHLTKGQLRTAFELIQDTNRLERTDSIIKDSKRFLQSSLEQKVAIISSYTASAEQAMDFIESLLTILRAGLRSARDNQNRQAWVARCKQALRAQRRLNNHVQPRLVIAELMLEL